MAQLFEAGLPVSLWPLAFANTIYCLNKLPLEALNFNSTAEFEIFGVRPFVGHMRVFGCIAYVTLPENKQLSLGLKGKEGRLVGYAKNSLSYWIWFSDGTVLKTGDVRFDETLINHHLPRQYLKNVYDLDLENSEDDGELTVASPRRVGAAEMPVEGETFVPEHALRERVAVTSGSTALVPILRRPERSNAGRNSHLEEIYRVDQRALISALFTGDVLTGQSVSNPEDLDMSYCFVSDSDSASYEETLSGNDADKWAKSRCEEIDSLENLKLFSKLLTSIPDGRKALNHKWVHKKKRSPQGTVLKYKSRLTVKGFGQVAYIDYKETFAPVASHNSLLLLLALACAKRLFLWQADVSNA